jgi:hypothetical protein
VEFVDWFWDERRQQMMFRTGPVLWIEPKWFQPGVPRRRYRRTLTIATNIHPNDPLPEGFETDFPQQLADAFARVEAHRPNQTRVKDVA